MYIIGIHSNPVTLKCILSFYISSLFKCTSIPLVYISSLYYLFIFQAYNIKNGCKSNKTKTTTIFSKLKRKEKKK